MPDVHARLSASGAKKWINCPGSIQLEETIPEETSSFAEEGTKAHALGELKLQAQLGLIKPATYNRRAGKLGVDDAAMEEYTDGYAAFVLERFHAAQKETPDAQILIEQRLDFSEYVPDGFGTGDAVVIGDGTLEIIDLKYGAGVKVSAENNPQLRLYALGAANEFGFLYDIEKIRMTIYQPRMDNISSETISVSKLIEWGEDISLRAVIAADDSIVDCVAGDHCDSGFCRARPVCRAYAEKRLDLARYDFKAPAELTVAEIACIMGEADKLAKWAKLVTDYALDAAVNRGMSFPGYKVVEGRSVRKYGKPDEDIEKILTDNGYKSSDIYVRSLRGITDLEKFLGKKRFAELLKDCIIKPAGKPTLVPDDDPRPAIHSAAQAAADFKDV